MRWRRPPCVHQLSGVVGSRLYIAPSLGKLPLDELKPSQVSDFYRSQLLHLSPGSVRRLYALLRRSPGVAVRAVSNPSGP
jgi:hypothetical protein